MTRTIVASATREIIIGFDQPFCVIGERINPTGRKKLAAEMIVGNFDTVIRDALEQVAAGATMLDVNAGVTSVNPNETEPGLLVSGGPERVGTAWRSIVPGRVADNPFLGCCTRAGRSRRSICAGLISRSFFLKASGSGAERRS